MKKMIALLLALVMVLGMAACGEKAPEQTNAPAQQGGENKPTEGENKPAEGENTLEGTYDITMWVSEMDGVVAMTQEMIDAFEAANPGIVINAQIEGVTEADVGS